MFMFRRSKGKKTCKISQAVHVHTFQLIVVLPYYYHSNSQKLFAKNLTGSRNKNKHEKDFSG